MTTQPPHRVLLARLEAERAKAERNAPLCRGPEARWVNEGMAAAHHADAALVLAVFEGPEAAAAYMRGEASGCAEGKAASGDLPTDEDFLVALEGALEKRLLPKPGIGVLEDVRGAVMQALGPLVGHLRAEVQSQIDMKIGVAGEWGNALADKTAAEATLRAVREYVETSDDDGIRTREAVLRVLGGQAGEPGERKHIGGNAEDCPGCHGTNPPYPFICPGPGDRAA